jgi:heat shock protein HslJ
MTQMACDDAVMRLEQFFLIGLESTRTYTIDEDGLSIDFGGGVLRFVADGVDLEGAG